MIADFMLPSTSRFSFRGLLFYVATLAFATIGLCGAEAPQVGEVAPAFTLKSLDGDYIRLSELTARGPVVLVVLRGWPGYQCPICDRQVNELVTAQAAFAAAKAVVVFVYPGPAADLALHAAEFKTMKGREWPAEFRYGLDPDYTVVSAYGLRWDAPKETAYPSTFIIDGRGVVHFAKISHTHGDRTKASDILAKLNKTAAP